MIIRKIGRNGRWVKQIRRGGRILWECHEEKLKLSAPVIWLEGSADVVPESYTPAILGNAILGRTILGRTSVAAAKLAAPVIRLEVSSGKLDAPVIWLQEQQEIVKLDAPIIELVTVAEQAKLSAPVIYLETELPKLSAPVIYLHTEEEPDAPVVQKLDAPVIYLEVIEDEPDIPDVPITPKLSTPEIYLYEEDAGEPEQPTITATLDGDTVRWNAVEGASSYGVSVWGNSQGKMQTTTLTYMLLNTIGLTLPGAYDVTVYAYGEDGTALCVSEAIQYVYRPKLNAPVISLEVTEDQEPEQPVKLDAPEIYVFEGEQGEFPESGGGGGGTIPVKLDTPIIRLEVAEEEPDVLTLAAPVLRVDGIYLCWDAVEGATKYEWWFKTKEANFVSEWSYLPLPSTTLRVSLEGFNTSVYPGGVLYTYLVATADDIRSEPSNEITYIMQPPAE